MTPTPGDPAETTTTLVLSAGAPHSPLMAGALYALYKAQEKYKKKHFDFIFTSGAGALIGLLLIAPKGDKEEDKPPESLRKVLKMGIADKIYRWVPVGYKTFFKPGPFTRPFHRLAQRFKVGGGHPDSLTEAWWNFIGIAPGAGAATPTKEFVDIYNDSIDLWFSLITPTTLNYWSKGLCAPPPFLNDLVDFDVANNFKRDFCVNAYRLANKDQGIQQGMEEFSASQNEITVERLQAALAFPFIYPPGRADYVDAPRNTKRASYVEGAEHEPVYTPLHTAVRRLRNEGVQAATIVLIDILASFEAPLAREPRDLWDAYGLSIIAPIVELAKTNLAEFRREHRADNVLEVSFKGLIPEDHLPYMLDWSQSNLQKLWDAGITAGERFAEKYLDELPNRRAPTPR